MNNLSKSNESYYQKIKANQKKLIIFLADQIGHSNLHCVQLYNSFYLIRSIKKILKLIVIVSGLWSSVAISLSAVQAMSVVKANPALLNTPQAQAELAKRGLSKGDITNKLNITDTKVGDVLTNTAINDVDVESEKSDGVIVKAKGVYANPLAYQSNTDLLKLIKSKQNIKTNATLERFSKVFFRNKNKTDHGSLPVPDYYIVSHGDMMSIWVYGVTEESFEAEVDSYGNINIPIVGPISVAGLSFKDAKNLIVSKLVTAYMNASIIVNIAKYSTIQVSLTGNVKAPGIYNISALSTVKDLLVHAGGVKNNGTVRSITLQRADGSVYAVDLYELLLGKSNKPALFLRTGDVVYIPNAHKLVGISGSVNTPAKFELKIGENLDKLINYAGDIHAGGSHYGLKVSGFNNEKSQVRVVDEKNSKDFSLNDRDSVYVYPIDRIKDQSVNIFGNMVRPGERGLGGNTSLAKLIAHEVDTFGLQGVFLENTLFNFAIIKRKTNTLGKEFIRVNVAKVLTGDADVNLQAGDELYVFNKLDSALNPYVKISGTIVSKTGEFQFIDGMSVGDLIQVAGITGPYDDQKIKLVTYQTKDLMPKVLILTGIQAQDTQLNAFDEVELFDYYSVNQIAKANINGEVNFGGEYVIHSGMNLSSLIASAGGLTNKAYLDRAEVLRYKVKNSGRVEEIIAVNLNQADGFVLNNYDEITIYRIPNWYDKQTISLTGQVKFPGMYTFNDGDRLSDVVTRAGGFTDNAFLYGASFERESVKKMQQQALRDAMMRLKKKLAIVSSQPREAGEGQVDKANLSETLSVLTEQGSALTPLGRVTINLPSNISVLKGSSSDIILKDGDKLNIPTSNDTVMVIGEVMSPTAVIYDDDDDVMSYISKVGGFTPIADDDQIYVVHANGEAQQFGGDLFLSTQAQVKPGDVIVVPQMLITSTGIQVAKDISSILYQFAVTAASLKTVGAF